MAIDTDPASARAGGRAFVSLVRSIAAFAGRRGILALVYVALGALFESVGLILLIPLLALVIGKGAGNGRLQYVTGRIFEAVGVATPFGRLALLLGLFAVLMVIRGVVVSLRDNMAMSLQIGFVEHLRGQVASALAEAGWDQVLRLRHARVMSIMSGDIQRIASAAHFLLQAAIAVVLLLAQCVLSFALSPRLALFSFALLIAGGIAMVPVLRRARLLGRFVSGANMSLIETAAQFLSGLKLALSQDLQGGFVAEFRQTLNALTASQLRYNRRQTAGRVALTTLTALVGALVILVGYGVLGLPPAVLITFLLVVGRMSGPASQIQQGFQQLAYGLPAYETVAELLAELSPAPRQQAAMAQRLPEGPIVLEAVGFQHPHTDDSGSHGVRRASLHIAPGSFVGIAGTSGAGKTTLADLLVGLLRPQQGRILVGGTLLDEATLPAWRAQLSYVSQDPFLFHDTVRRNLQWTRPAASESEMWAALTLAGADGIVRRMAGGLDAIVGERGTLVSGGERQRIALARALLRQPRLLVMDEATNAIDIAGERALLERLLALRLTVVMIAHRAESLALCDRVVHMADGVLEDDAAAPPRERSGTGLARLP
ncbi:MAG TPA: ABC transporter ATP-binding protein [Rhizomicrobium sp.]|jgi:ABC-type multidrug transport system fused ATPase/permease subunit|nr:ABC transporter ATP-binding protein [Rhizomicrobium sp.]